MEELERAQYRALAGLQDKAGLSEIYDRHAVLFQPAAFRAVNAAPNGGNDKRSDYLREFLAIGIEGHRTRELQDSLLTLEATSAATVEGERVPYRQLPVRIRQEPTRTRRRGLETARIEIVERRLNPLLIDLVGRQHEVADELLGTSYDRYCETLSGVDFDRLEHHTGRLLDETQDAYDDLLRWFAGRTVPDVEPAELELADLARVLYGPDFDALFPPDRMVERIRGSIEAMGLDLTADGRIELDLEPRPSKTPRAFCAPIRVPDEVNLVLQPIGGYDDYAIFLHELGHALHYAHVDPAQPIEHRRLGDNAVTEAFAFLLEHLIQVPAFLERVLEVRRPDEFLRFIAFRQLVLVRRYAAKFRYERSLHREGPGPARSAEYAERLTAATGARTPEALYLDDVDPHFYCVRYLRAWMLVGTLHLELRERFDEDWFLNPRSGAFLRELWGLGQALPAEELAVERLGVEELSFEPLLQAVDERV